jgi:pyruvate dehydrogenase E1 component alpha subunit
VSAQTRAAGSAPRQAQGEAERGLKLFRSLQLFKDMLRVRRFEEKCVELYSETKIRGFLHLYIGEEAVAAGTMTVLRPEDNVVATYREHGHALLRGVSANAIMAEMYGKVEGCSRGRGGSMHLFDAQTRFYGGNAIVGGGLPLAVGLALADQMQGRAAVTACFFGDGAVSEGVFHESLNLASLWRLPVVFLCENNLYAMGTALGLAQASTDIAAKAASYAMPSSAIDGMDVLAVERATAEAVSTVRAGNGPYLLEFRTYRFRAHSMFDPELYRTREEVETWKKRDPVLVFAAELMAQGALDDERVAQLEEEVSAEIRAAVEFAEAGAWEPVEELARFVYSEQGTP